MFFSGLRQVNKLSDGVKRVVFRYRWECFGCFIEEGAFWGGGKEGTSLLIFMVYRCVGGP